MDTQHLNPLERRAASAGARRGFGRLCIGRWLAAAGLALGAAVTAHAADVYWSIGIHQPGVSVGVSNAPPVVVATAPPRWHRAAPVVVMPSPVVVLPAPVRVVTPPGHWKPRAHRHRDWRDRRDRYDRYDRDSWRGDDWRRGEGRHDGRGHR